MWSDNSGLEWETHAEWELQKKAKRELRLESKTEFVQTAADEYDYKTNKPVPTVYNGVAFRSKLEAQWAAFFDQNIVHQSWLS